jgi:hypothetical protein
MLPNDSCNFGLWKIYDCVFRTIRQFSDPSSRYRFFIFIFGRNGPPISDRHAQISPYQKCHDVSTFMTRITAFWEFCFYHTFVWNFHWGLFLAKICICEMKNWWRQLWSKNQSWESVYFICFACLLAWLCASELFFNLKYCESFTCYYFVYLWKLRNN